MEMIGDEPFSSAGEVRLYLNLRVEFEMISAALAIACFYGGMSSLATYSQKRIYKEFPQFSSPLALLWFQSLINLVSATLLLTIKARNPKLLA